MVEDLRRKRIALLAFTALMLATTLVVSWSFPLRQGPVVPIDTAPLILPRPKPRSIATPPPLTQEEARKLKERELTQKKISEALLHLDRVLARTLAALCVVGLGIAALHLFLQTPRRRLGTLRTTGDEVMVVERLHDTLVSASRALDLDESYGEIIRDSYMAMLRTLLRATSTSLSSTFTAREFADAMEKIGIHSPAVAELTQLYESVRYRDHDPTEEERQRARACVRALLESLDTFRACSIGERT